MSRSVRMPSDGRRRRRRLPNPPRCSRIRAAASAIVSAVPRGDDRVAHDVADDASRLGVGSASGMGGTSRGGNRAAGVYDASVGGSRTVQRAGVRAGRRPPAKRTRRLRARSGCERRRAVAAARCRSASSNGEVPLLVGRQPVRAQAASAGARRARARAPRRPSSAPPGSTTRLARPMRSASSPETPRPVRIRSSACDWPIRRGRRTVPPSMSGTPQRRQNTPKTASSRRDAEVAPQRELEPAGDRVALDGGDHRLARAACGVGPSARRRRRATRLPRPSRDAP